MDVERLWVRGCASVLGPSATASVGRGVLRRETKHVRDDDAWCNRPQAGEVKYGKTTGARCKNIYTEAKGSARTRQSDGMLWQLVRLISLTLSPQTRQRQSQRAKNTRPLYTTEKKRPTAAWQNERRKGKVVAGEGFMLVLSWKMTNVKPLMPRQGDMRQLRNLSKRIDISHPSTSAPQPYRSPCISFVIHRMLPR